MISDAVPMEESERYHCDTTRKDPFGGSVLVGDNQQIYVTTYDPMSAAPNCPTDYWWTSTGNPKVRIVRKVSATTDKEEGFCDLPLSETLPAACNDIQLE